MDLIQLYSATQRVMKSLKTSGLMPALKQYRSSLRGQAKGERARIESVLMQASEAYIEKTTMYGECEVAVVNLLHLADLGKSSYWQELTSNVRSVEVRLAHAVSAYSKIMFATSHLPGLLALVRETSAVEGLRTDEPDSATLVLRLYDSIETAASPDRMSRLIDSVDMLYSACAAMSDAAPDSIRLMSVSGVAVRSVVFHGELQTVNALHSTIADLNNVSVQPPETENYSVEAIASAMPLLGSINELEKLDAMSPEIAADARREALEGAIMLLECGAQLVDHDGASDASYMSSSVIARLDADGESFDRIDSRIGDSIDQRYNEVYEREKQRLMNEPAAVADDYSGTAKNDHEAGAISSRGERTANKTPQSPKTDDARKDSIDELIIDLNRLYGEQRN